MNVSDAFPSKYIKSDDLKGRDVTVTIEGYEMVAIQNEQSRKLALRFEGKDKQWIVNKTNANTIAKLLNSGRVEDWIGKQITIYPTETAYQGEMVDCIRVRRNKAETFAPEPPRNIAPLEPPDDYDPDSAPF